jgi:hypothetical protein
MQGPAAPVEQAPFTAENVISALQTLHTDPQKYAIADKWLMSFQDQPVAFSISLRLLEHTVKEKKKKKKKKNLRMFFARKTR